MGNELRARRTEEILHAAFQEFSENGYDHAKMEDIARRAGIGKSTVYEYFPSKLELLTATGNFLLEEIFREVEALFTADRPVRQSLADYWEYICTMMGCIGANFLQIVGNDEVTKIVHALAERYLVTMTQHLTQALEAAKTRGEIAPHADVSAAATLLVTMPNPPFVKLSTPERLRESIERLIDILFEGLRPRQEAPPPGPPPESALWTPAGATGPRPTDASHPSLACGRNGGLGES